MAVTITIEELRAALRLTDSTEETAEVTRLLAYCTEAVEKHVPTAPDTIHNEAVRRLCGYLFDMPEAARGDAYSNALRNSGASRMLLPYRVHRLGYTDTVAEANAAVGSVGNPVTGLSITGDVLTVTFADGTTQELTLPAGSGGMFSGVDATARAQADTAQAAADAAQADADANATTITGKLERADVRPGVGIAITPTANNPTELTISATGGATGPMELTGVWEWVYVQALDAGEVMEVGVLQGEIGTWLFNTTGGAYSDDRAALLDLAAGDQVEISQSATRHQLITVTDTPTLSGNAVTVSGRASRFSGSQLPSAFAAVTVTLIPGPIQGVDQLARDSAAEARGAAKTAQATADGKLDTAGAQALVDTHTAIANAHHIPPAGGGGSAWSWFGQVTGAFVANTARDLTVFGFPQLGYADYAALRAGVVSGEVTQIAIRISESDPGGSDDDGAVFIIPNILGFYHGAAGSYRAFPAWNLGVNPIKCDLVFGATAVTVKFDAAQAADPLVVVRIGVFK